MQNGGNGSSSLWTTITNSAQYCAERPPSTGACLFLGLAELALFVRFSPRFAGLELNLELLSDVALKGRRDHEHAPGL